MNNQQCWFICTPEVNQKFDHLKITDYFTIEFFIWTVFVFFKCNFSIYQWFKLHYWFRPLKFHVKSGCSNMVQHACLICKYSKCNTYTVCLNTVKRNKFGDKYLFFLWFCLVVPGCCVPGCCFEKYFIRFVTTSWWFIVQVAHHWSVVVSFVVHRW